MGNKKVILFVGPSGSGKTFLVRHLMMRYPDYFHKAISTTSRAPRANEREGVDYYFRGPLYFASESFLEQTVYAGNIYGLTCDEVLGKRKEKPLLCVVDIKGLKQIEKLIGKDNVVSFFIFAPIETLKARMESRGDSPEKIQERLKNLLSEHEIENAKFCDYKIHNDKDINKVLEDIEKILVDEKVLES